MTALAKKIAKKALTLSEDDRTALVEVLLRSLKPPSEDEEIDRLWAKEAERRVQEIEDGKVTLLDGHQVMQEIRDRLRRGITL